MGDRPLQRAGLVVDVRVGEQHVLAGRARERDVHRVHLAEPAGRQLADVQRDDPRVLACEPIDDLAGVVGRAVVDDDVLGVRVALGEARPQSGFDRRALVARGDDDGHARPLGRRRRRDVGEERDAAPQQERGDRGQRPVGGGGDGEGEEDGVGHGSRDFTHRAGGQPGATRLRRDVFAARGRRADKLGAGAGVRLANRLVLPGRRLESIRVMTSPGDLRDRKFALDNNASEMPALGFGTLIPDPVATRAATKAALEAGFRLIDTAERYRTEREVGDAMREVFDDGNIAREDVFVVTKLWNTNHRPERVRPAFEASVARLGLDYVDLYLVHTAFAFRPGDDQDPRDASGKVVYDDGVTLLDTWRAMEALVDTRRCRAIGLSDVSLAQTREIVDAARIKPAVVHVESHPYLPEWELLTYCRANGIVLQAFAALGHSSEPKLIEHPIVVAIAKRVNKTPAQVLLAWAIQRGTAPLTTSKNPGRIRENFDVSALPDDAVQEISDGVTSRVRFNAVVETGVPGFIARDTHAR